MIEIIGISQCVLHYTKSSMTQDYFHTLRSHIMNCCLTWQVKPDLKYVVLVMQPNLTQSQVAN